MIKITLAIGGSGRGNPDRDLRTIVELVLKTAAPLTADKAKTESSAQFTSDSLQVGRDGTYYVKNLSLPACSDAQKWTRGCPAPIANPVGLFVRLKEKEPVMVLEGFQPLKLKAKDEGGGSLMRKDGTRAFVEWYVESV